MIFFLVRKGSSEPLTCRDFLSLHQEKQIMLLSLSLSMSRLGSAEVLLGVSTPSSSFRHGRRS